MTVRKLMWFTIGFAMVCLLSAYMLPRQYFLPGIVGCCILLAGSLVLMLRFKQVRIAVAMLLGAAIAFCWLNAFDSLYLSTVRAYDEQRGYISVTVMDQAEPTNYGCVVPGRIELDGKYYNVRLYLYGEDKPVLGDTVTGNFQLHSTLPDGSWASSYNCGNSTFFCISGGKNVRVTKVDALPLICYPTQIRHEITALLDSLFPEDTIAFARALLLGDMSLVDYETETALKVSGIMHVVSVSGMHVSILFGLINLLTGRRKWLVLLLGLPVLFVFAAVVGFEAPIIRACFMYTVMVSAMLVGKEYDAPTSLSFAVLLMLCMNPYTAVNIAFQLSVGCMIGILAFAEPIRDWLLDRKRLGRFKCRKLMSGISVSIGVSLGATIVTMPLCAYYFGIVSLVGVLTNLLTLWMLTYVFYGILLACAMGVLIHPAGAAVAWLASWGIRYTLVIAKAMAALPFAAVYMENIYMWFWLAFSYILLVVYLRMYRKRPAFLMCSSAVGLCLALILSWSEPLLDDCRVTVLDVGQGQCILLQSEGKTFLVDCGGDSEEIAADKAAGLLLSQGISRLDGLILTHYDNDHAGGVEYLLSRVPADALYLPELTQQQTILFGDAKITLIPAEKGEDDNESGLCVLFQTENCDILITGDRSSEGELSLMQAIDLPELELLIVGHHGSKYSTCGELLEKTNPEYAIISVGVDNPYGHPTREVLERLQMIGSTVYRTDENGTVVYRG